MSGKKEALANIAGLDGVRDAELFEHAKQRGVLYEGFSTYGGLAGRDSEAMAVGLREAVTHRTSNPASNRSLNWRPLLDVGVPIYGRRRPRGVREAEEYLPNIPREQFPGQVLAGELYREGGVRAVQLGEFVFRARTARNSSALSPRRTNFREHLEHIAETFETVGERRDELSGLEIVWEPPMEELRHFSAKLEPVE